VPADADGRGDPNAHSDRRFGSPTATRPSGVARRGSAIPDYLLGRTDRCSQSDSDRFDLARLDGHTLVTSADEPPGRDYGTADLIRRIQREEIGASTEGQLLAFRSAQRDPFFFISVRVDPSTALGEWESALDPHGSPARCSPWPSP
jgi:hypothetical protein